jgi:hypothetical protein
MHCFLDLMIWKGMANVRRIWQTLQDHHTSDHPCGCVHRYGGECQSRPTSDISFILVVGIFVITISSKVRPGVDIFHVATTWVTAYFSLTMTTNIVLSSKYFYFVRILIGLYSNGLTRVQVQSHYEFFLLAVLYKVRGRTG